MMQRIIIEDFIEEPDPTVPFSSYGYYSNTSIPVYKSYKPKAYRDTNLEYYNGSNLNPYYSYSYNYKSTPATTTTTGTLVTTTNDMSPLQYTGTMAPINYYR